MNSKRNITHTAKINTSKKHHWSDEEEDIKHSDPSDEYIDDHGKKHCDKDCDHEKKEKPDKCHKDHCKSPCHVCPPCKNGHNGKNGFNGFNGLNGLNGKDGKDGATGPMGPAGTPGNTDLTAYGYVFNTKSGTVPSGPEISFSDNLPSMVDIEHTPGTAQITVRKAGVYNINFYVYTTNTVIQKIGVTVNGTVQASFNTNTGNGNLSGTIMLRLKKDDLITLRDIDNNNIDITPSTFINAYVSIFRVGA
jgi:hypothetical protein